MERFTVVGELLRVAGVTGVPEVAGEVAGVVGGGTGVVIRG